MVTRIVKSFLIIHRTNTAIRNFGQNLKKIQPVIAIYLLHGSHACRDRVPHRTKFLTSTHTVFVVQRVTLAEALLNLDEVQRQARADLRQLDGRLLHTHT